MSETRLLAATDAPLAFYDASLRGTRPGSHPRRCKSRPEVLGIAVICTSL